jgi:hypothetical protein
VILGLILLNEVEVEVEVDEDSEAHQRLVRLELALMPSGRLVKAVLSCIWFTVSVDCDFLYFGRWAGCCVGRKVILNQILVALHISIAVNSCWQTGNHHRMSLCPPSTPAFF